MSSSEFFKLSHIFEKCSMCPALVSMNVYITTQIMCIHNKKAKHFPLPQVFVGSRLVGSQVQIFKEAVTSFDLWIDVNSLVPFVNAVGPGALLPAYQLKPLCPLQKSLYTRVYNMNGFPHLNILDCCCHHLMMNEQPVIKSLITHAAWKKTIVSFWA